jgi:transcriptional regulator with XRE-family HTH domain
MALARKAGLSVNYVSILERGERLPRWETAGKLARALELAGADRDRFFRLIDATSKPGAAQAATVGPPIPDLVLWKHLPADLYAVKHRFLRWRATAPDDIASDAVRTAGSLLGYIAAATAELSRPERDRILELAAATIRERDRDTAPRAAPMAPADVAVLADPGILCHAWRRYVFADARRRAAAVRELTEWSYREEPGFGEAGLLSFSFRRPALADRYNVALVSAPSVVELHDAMLAHRLWDFLHLGESRGGMASSVFVRWLPQSLVDAIRWVLVEFTPEKLRRSLRTEASADDAEHVFNEPLARELFKLTRIVRMGLRAFEVSSLGALVFESLVPTASRWAQRAKRVLGPSLGMVLDLTRPGGGLPPPESDQIECLRKQLTDACASIESTIRRLEAAHSGRPARPLDDW